MPTETPLSGKTIQVWLHGIGSLLPHQLAGAASLVSCLETGLAQLAGSRIMVRYWRPFQSFPPAEPHYLLLILTMDRKHDSEEYFAVANALALHRSGRATLIPIYLESNNRGAASVSTANPWARRCAVLEKKLEPLNCVALADSHDWQVALAPEVWNAINKSQPTFSPEAGPVTVFFSYSHKDESFRDELSRHLKLLERTGLIKGWHDRRIAPGENWAEEIDEHLYTADIILLLLSSDFFASDYCYELEAPVALKRHNLNAAGAVPVVLRPVVWQQSPLVALQALPTDAKPVITWEPIDSAYVNVCEGIISCVLAWKRAMPLCGSKTAMPPRPEISTRKRVMDVALPAHVETDRSAMLVVLIRKAQSGGLKAVVVADATYGIEESDVRSSPVSLEFPINKEGKPERITLKIKVQSPDFSPPSQERQIPVEPGSDSQTCIYDVSRQSSRSTLGGGRALPRRPPVDSLSDQYRCIGVPGTNPCTA